MDHKPTLNPGNSMTEVKTLEKRISIGKILAPHGVKGEVKVLPLTDFPERFSQRDRVWVDRKSTFLEIEGVRQQNRFLLIKLAGINDRDEAENLKNALIQVPEEEVVPLPSGHYYHFQIVGLKVYDIRGNFLGVINDILETGANDIYLVPRPDKKDLLIPALKTVVLEINPASGRMTVEIPAGLDD